MISANSPADPPHFAEIVDRFVSDFASALPFDAAETIEPHLHGVQARRYSALVPFDLISEKRMWSGFLKVGSAKETTAEYELLRTYGEQFGGADDALGVVRPVAHLPQYAALITERLPGRDLSAELKATVGRRQRAVPEPLVRACERAGQWLLRFHLATREADRIFSLDEMRAYIDQRLVRLADSGFLGFSAGDRDRLLEFFDTQALRVPDEDLAVAAIHGDYSPGNLMVSAARLVIIDFPRPLVGSLYHDVGHLHLHLEALAQHPRYSRRVARTLCRALLKGFEDPGLPERGIFRLFEAQHATCSLAEHVDEPAVPGFAGRLVQRYVHRKKLERLRRLSRSIATQTHVN